MSKNNPDMNGEHDGMESRAEGSSDDTAPSMRNVIETLGSDLDMLSERLAKLEGHLSGRAQGAPVSEEPEYPESYHGPRIIKEGWTHLEPQIGQVHENGLSEEMDPHSAEGRQLMETIERLRKHKEEVEQRIEQLTAQIEQEEGRKLDLGGHFGGDKAGMDREAMDALQKLTREKDIQVQVARTQAYALHAAGKYGEAAQAYQAYFDLLGDASDDISTLRASRECAAQGEQARQRTKKRWTLAGRVVVLLGIWLGCIIYVANRTAESARLAAGNGDLDSLRIYCDRLKSPSFVMGSLGAVGYIYGPELSRWRRQIDGEVQKKSEVVTVVTNTVVVTVTNTLPEMVAEPVASDDEADAAENHETVVVVTNYLDPPILSFSLTPRDAEAVVYNSDFKKLETAQSVALLKFGGRYLLLVRKDGYDLYLEPIFADWEGVKRFDVSLIRSGEHDDGSGKAKPSCEATDGKKDGDDSTISLHELFRLMEDYEISTLKKRLHVLEAGRDN